MRETERPVVLIADDNAAVRELIAAIVAERCDVAVIEAEDGAHAVQLGLQRRPAVGVLDLHMPRLDGIRAAATLRGLLPALRLALYSADPGARATAQSAGLPFFAKLELEALVGWTEAQVTPIRAAVPKQDLACSRCGYGIFTRTPPSRCPHCLADDPWKRAKRPAAAGGSGH